MAESNSLNVNIYLLIYLCIHTPIPHHVNLTWKIHDILSRFFEMRMLAIKAFSSQTTNFPEIPLFHLSHPALITANGPEIYYGFLSYHSKMFYFVGFSPSCRTQTDSRKYHKNANYAYNLWEMDTQWVYSIYFSCYYYRQPLADQRIGHISKQILGWNTHTYI